MPTTSTIRTVVEVDNRIYRHMVLFRHVFLYSGLARKEFDRRSTGLLRGSGRCSAGRERRRREQMKGQERMDYMFTSSRRRNIDVDFRDT